MEVHGKSIYIYDIFFLLKAEQRTLESDLLEFKFHLSVFTLKCCL